MTLWNLEDQCRTYKGYPIISILNQIIIINIIIIIIIIIISNLERPWQRKMDMIFGTWNVRSLNRARAQGLVISEIDRCRMDLVGVQEVRWEGSGTLESGN